MIHDVSLVKLNFKNSLFRNETNDSDLKITTFYERLNAFQQNITTPAETAEILKPEPKYHECESQQNNAKFRVFILCWSTYTFFIPLIIIIGELKCLVLTDSTMSRQVAIQWWHGEQRAVHHATRHVFQSGRFGMFVLSLRLTTRIIQPVHLSPFRLADIAKYKPKSKSLTLGCDASKSGAHCRLPDNQFLYLSIPVLLVANHTVDA